MSTVHITTAEALVRYLVAQRTEVDGVEVPLYPGVFAIFGHGNVTSLGHALEQHRDEIPVWRGQTEEGMGLAAVAFAKATRRRQVMVATSSIGPGATNMVTAAGVAMSNRLPTLFVSGDAFASRLPDPVLQQVEHFGDPSTTVNDSFRPVVRYWDRITHPAQLLTSLPQVTRTLLDPADCGPVFLGLPQDVAATAYDYPESFFEPTVHRVPRPRADLAELERAAEALRAAERPVLVAGGGVHYSLAEAELAQFAERHGIPVVETVAGKSSVLGDHPRYAGPIGVTGAAEPNEACREADVVLAVGTRLNDFVTGSWTLFDERARIVALNTARFDATKHLATPVVGDARESLTELSALLGDWTAPAAWTDHGSDLRERFDRFVAARVADDGEYPLSYAQVVGAVHRAATPEDYVMTAAGGLPGELNVNWSSKAIASFDCEYGFSCMGYETAGAWGAAFARPAGEVYCLVGDGSYLMLNSEIYSSVLSGRKYVLVVCDNAGFAVIERLQRNQGGASYNNMLRDSRGPHSDVRVDFVAHAASLGAHATRASSLAELEAAIEQAREHDRTSVVVVDVREADWTEGGLYWQVGVPEVSELESVREARAAHEAGLTDQRRGV
ncbi:3D-(3,5/4)-trihydroxycyclohexane-1,2-dione acylhydrolase (decyclizing) [Phycicoccus flavus]|uniref:3D-(3,5/4)-trihydroxycyclohexane-1,2-dione acylhydrolase (Decyclizing) n=1 Tax=Phycicoccus flavus TaxID=2502783 RepID=A0A8T6R1A0_9MICO|nr:3D-(3,5/4)-trihydroxycyclohexane-1,2-dione acylhydrolase (decyclizing) [Phycicoccus flavus]NHA67737.1 3D-(3,5/4)-trihydroxycyclohexane-1,2-dione acylhydrolase (decyclizing) [Phycicoccus flavus]